MPSVSRRACLASFLGAGLAPQLLSQLQAADARWQISTFTEEVTPPIGHPCMGGGIAPVKKIEDPLYAIGFVLQGAGKPIVVVSVDWCEIRNDAYDRWRSAIAEAVGTDRERVIVSAIHQHDTPIADLTAQKFLEKHQAKGSICDLAFHEKTVQRVAKTIQASLKKAQPLTHIGTGQAKVEQVASNRRYLDEAGKVQYNRMSASRDPKVRAGEEGTIDPFLKTLSFWNGDKPILALHAYATHPMSYYGRGGTTTDFVGMARQRRQTDEPEILQMYVSGCSGNVTAGKYNDGAVENRPVLAERIYKAMKSAWQSTKRQPIPQITFRNEPLILDARKSAGFSEKELMAHLTESPRPFQQCLAALGLSWRQRVEAKQPIDVPVIDFGICAYLLMPAESYVEFQLYAQKQRPNDFIVVAGYGESGPGYIPIERAWKENDSNLGDWSWIDQGSELKMNAVIEKVLKAPAK